MALTRFIRGGELVVGCLSCTWHTCVQCGLAQTFLKCIIFQFTIQSIQVGLAKNRNIWEEGVRGMGIGFQKKIFSRGNRS